MNQACCSNDTNINKSNTIQMYTFSLHEWVAGLRGDAAHVALVSRHMDVSHHAPACAPAEKKCKYNLVSYFGPDIHEKTKDIMTPAVPNAWRCVRLSFGYIWVEQIHYDSDKRQKSHATPCLVY